MEYIMNGAWSEGVSRMAVAEWWRCPANLLFSISTRVVWGEIMSNTDVRYHQNKLSSSTRMIWVRDFCKKHTKYKRHN